MVAAAGGEGRMFSRAFLVGSVGCFSERAEYPVMPRVHEGGGYGAGGESTTRGGARGVSGVEFDDETEWGPLPAVTAE